MMPAVATYAPRDPSGTVLYHVIAEHRETFLTSLADDPEATGFPRLCPAGVLRLLAVRHPGTRLSPPGL